MNKLEQFIVTMAFKLIVI